jgi:hypothetical protein
MDALKKSHPYELNADDADYADTHGFEVWLKCGIDFKSPSGMRT